MQKKVLADRSALETILERLWDPIGVYQASSDGPCPPGEYDTYAGWIIGHLYEGGDRSSVLADMARARENMGLSSSSRDDEAADAILDWWQNRARSGSAAAGRDANNEVADGIADVFDGGMTDPAEPTLTLEQAYRATYHFIHQYYLREPITPFRLMLGNMEPWNEDGPIRQTSDPATWNDWMRSVRAALASDTLPPLGEVKSFPTS